MAERQRILFVDDESSFLNALRRILFNQRRVWDMNFVLSADEALDLARRGETDVVVSDVDMPGKDGFQLLTALREDERTRDVPFIILTGGEEQSFKRRALDLGATDLLNKPVSLEDLVARIWSALRLKAYQDELKAQKDMLERKVEERTAELAESRLDIVWRLAKAGEYRDPETGNHIVRVGYYCHILSEELGMTRDFTEAVFLTSPLHDIGKLGIPDDILLKSSQLTAEERRIMEQHCTIGAELLAPAFRHAIPTLSGREFARRPHGAPPENPILKMAAAIALSHHERWDGNGYPHRLAGEAIPLGGRITAVADVYDALCSVRPYKPAYPEEKTLAIMREEAACHFDPMVFAAFEKRLVDIRAIREQFADETNALLTGSP
jgi:putative two-component system response regulator